MAVPLLKKAQGNNISDTLSTSIGASDLTIPVTTSSLWSTNGGKVIIDRGNASQEIAYATGKSGSSLTIDAAGRGAEGTVAVGHNSGASIESVPTSGDWNDLITTVTNGFVVSSGALDTTKVVDLTTAQTLTNKNLTAPTVTGTVTATGATIASATFTTATITDSASNVMAKSLKSATTTVDVSAATAPTSGQVLTATGGTAATWQSAASTTKPVVVTATSGADFTTTSTSYVDSSASTSSVAITTSVTCNILIIVSGSGQNDTNTNNYTVGIGKGTNTSLLSRTVDPPHASIGNLFTIECMDLNVAAGTYTYHMGAFSSNGANTTRLVTGSVIMAIAFPA